MDHHEIIDHSLMYIESNLHEPLSVDSVAAAFHMSKFYFHRLFSAMMGCSLNHYILARRLNESAKLIQNSSVPLTEIAYQLNFGTQASFTRAFKRQYGVAPSALRTENQTLFFSPVPSVVKRPIKNINGDIVTDFTLTEFETTKVSGIAFEVDLATDDYKDEIRAYAKRLLTHVDKTTVTSCCMIYSSCQPNSTRFKALFGVPGTMKIDDPYHFTVDVPAFFCAKFKYSGDLLDIGNVLKTDYARFLKISRQETENSPIELIQAFDDIHHLESDYHIYAPVKKLPIDSEY